jgi:hypothetical protein
MPNTESSFVVCPIELLPVAQHTDPLWHDNGAPRTNASGVNSAVHDEQPVPLFTLSLYHSSAFTLNVVKKKKKMPTKKKKKKKSPIQQRR